MAYKAREEYTGPAASYAFEFPYLDATHVKLYVDGVEDTSRTLTGESDPASGGAAVPSSTPSAGAAIVVVRETPSGALVDFEDTAMLTEEDLDTANKQALYVAEEADDTAALALIAAEADATAAAASASAAASSASAAASSASSASSSATSASTAAGTATTKASEASASAAAAAATAAALGNVVVYKGTHDASTGSYPADPDVGDYWVIGTPGTIGGDDFIAEDKIIYNGSGWDIVFYSAPTAVQSVDWFDGVGVKGAVSVAEYNFTQSIPYGRDVAKIRHACSTGTATVELKDDSTVIDTLSVSSTPAEETITTHTIAKGSRVWLNVTAASSCEDLEVWFGG